MKVRSAMRRPLSLECLGELGERFCPMVMVHLMN